MKEIKDLVETHLSELTTKDGLSEVSALNDVIQRKCKKKVDPYLLKENHLPMYFTGDPDAEVVFIELNPSVGLGECASIKGGVKMVNFSYKEIVIRDFEGYMEFCKDFGKHKAGQIKKKGGKVPAFDRKQIEFFKGFGDCGLELKENENPFESFVKVRQNKLQLELVPFVSRNFAFKHFDDNFLEDNIKRLREIIKRKKREFVFITGKGMEKEFPGAEFKKIKIDGFKYHVRIGFKESDGVKYYFLPTFKMQSLQGNLMRKYGELTKGFVQS